MKLANDAHDSFNSWRGKSQCCWKMADREEGHAGSEAYKVRRDKGAVTGSRGDAIKGNIHHLWSTVFILKYRFAVGFLGFFLFVFHSKNASQTVAMDTRLEFKGFE